MNSALKPVGVPTSPVPPQLNKPLHQQNAPTTTYGQPINNIPQNLINLPHSTPIPTNAHSNNLHATNHYSVNVSNAPQPYAMGGSVPPPSNHPVANQSSPTKNIKCSSNTNNIINSHKVPIFSPTENVPDPPTVVADESTGRSQSNGPSEQAPILEQEASSQSHQAELGIKDKPTPPSQLNVPEMLVVNIEKPNETIKQPIEKLVEINSPPPEPKQTTQNADVEAMTPETALFSKPAGVPETPVVTTSEVLEPTVTPAPSIESSSTLLVASTATTSSDVPVQIEKIAEVVDSPQLQDIADSSTVKPASTSSASVPVPVSKSKQQIAKPTLKLATPHRSPVRKTKLPVQEASEPVKATRNETKPNQKSPGLVAKSKRTRTRTQPYQSPLPEVEMISKISAIASTSKVKSIDDKLIVFYKNEFLAVRNPDGGFYLCQALHNIYKSTRKLRILWLTQEKNDNDVYTPDFYDHTDFDCILTNINLTRLARGRFKLPDKERIRTDNILKRALAVEKGDTTPPNPTEEHPDGLDLSLYKEESQLKRGKANKRKASPLKTNKASDAIKSPEQAKVRKIEPRTKPPPVTKALVIKKALAVKAKESAVLYANRPVRTKSVDTEATNTITDIDQKKTKGKVKKAVAAIPPVPQPSTSNNIKTQPPRKQSLKSTEAVVPFLRKEPPVLKKEVPAKRELLVLKKESALKKEPPTKKEISSKRSSEGPKKEVQTTRKEMPVLKKEVSLVKKDAAVQKQVVTRKSNRGKK